MTSLRPLCCLAIVASLATWLIGQPAGHKPLSPNKSPSGDAHPKHLADFATANRTATVEQPAEAALPKSEFAHGERAHFHPHGEQICLSGCAASHHPTDELTGERFHRLINQYACQSAQSASQPLETLLFYGRQTRLLVKANGFGTLPQGHVEFLRRQLNKSHIAIALRVLDSQGKTIAAMPFTRVPFDRRHEFALSGSRTPTDRTQKRLDGLRVGPMKVSGTIKRVGVRHAWTRL